MPIDEIYSFLAIAYSYCVFLWGLVLCKGTDFNKNEDSAIISLSSLLALFSSSKLGALASSVLAKLYNLWGDNLFGYFIVSFDIVWILTGEKLLVLDFIPYISYFVDFYLFSLGFAY